MPAPSNRADVIVSCLSELKAFGMGISSTQA